MSSFLPSIDDLRKAVHRNEKRQIEIGKRIENQLAPKSRVNAGGLIAPGYLIHSDNLPDSERDELIENTWRQAHDASLPKKEQNNLLNFTYRLASVSDITPKLYEIFNQNRNTMSFWFSKLVDALKQSQKDGHHFFKIPETTVITLPIELSQYMRLDYQNTNEQSRKFFNDWLIKAFELDLNKEYFIKTGEFSSKFEFKNAHLTEPDQIGDYFSVISNNAMMVGAGLNNDVVVREYIDDPEHHDTIYDGMPLRTEFRTFIDCDNKQLIDIVPYWNPIVMRRSLSDQSCYAPDIQRDYQTYCANTDRLTKEFNQYHNQIAKEIIPIIDNLDLDGCWALDVMKSGDDFYLIDMSDMRDSALTELIPESKRRKYRNKLERK